MSISIDQPFKVKRPFRVYLATGSTVRLTTARPWIEKLQAHDISVHDWTRDPTFDFGMSAIESVFVDAATRDEDAIVACDLFWYIVPPEKSEGAASELVIARCYGKPIVGSGDFGSRNIFALRYIRPEMRFSSEHTAFAFICEAAERSKSWREDP